MNPASPRPVADVVADLIADTSPYLSCDECFQRLDVHAEAAAAGQPDTDPAMAIHLRACPACADEAAALVELLCADPG